MKYIKPELEIIRINAEDIMAASAENGLAPKTMIGLTGDVTTAVEAGSATSASIFE